MKFMDEVRTGDRCTVTDLRTGLQHIGTVRATHQESDKVDVEYDTGRLVRVGLTFVQVHGDDSDEAIA